MKLYYTDPLASAHMAREFGVKVLIENIRYQPDNGEDPYKWSSDWTEIIECLNFKSGGIHPDSYHIFELKPKDLIVVPDSTIPWEVSPQGKYWNDSESWGPTDDYKIIQRDNKPFFWPKEEL